MVPYKRTFATVSVVFSGMGTWLLRSFMQEWGMSLADLSRHPFTIVYFGGSMLVGTGVCYYYDSPTNHKLHTILMRGMQLLGLVLLFLGTSLPELAVSTVAGLIAAKLWILLQQFRERSHGLQPHRQPAEREVPGPSNGAAKEHELHKSPVFNNHHRNRNHNSIAMREDFTP